jgi:hypothetical protein
MIIDIYKKKVTFAKVMLFLVIVKNFLHDSLSSLRRALLQFILFIPVCVSYFCVSSREFSVMHILFPFPAYLRKTHAFLATKIW